MLRSTFIAVAAICKSLYVTVDKEGYPINTLFVTLWNDETLSFPLSVEGNSYLDLNSVDFANLDEDEEQEIIVSCWFGFYYMGIYVLDISSNTFLPVPVLADTEELPGVDYQVTNNSYQTMTIFNDKTGFSEKINLEEILTANYAKKKPYISYSEDEYKNAYNSSDSDICYVTYWSGRYSIEMYEEQECLVLEQPITGAWGKNDGIGFVETGMRWDEEGNCELLFSRYALPDKHDS